MGPMVALHKSKSTQVFHGRPLAGSYILLSGVRIKVKPYMKYLEVILDSHWSFHGHFYCLAFRLIAVIGNLSWLLPNLERLRKNSRERFTARTQG